MEANLVGGGVAKPKRAFPYSNWGPWMGVLGVLAALAVGVFFAAPALLVGKQEGKIEARFPPSFETAASFDTGDATAIAVDGTGNRFFSDHEDEVRVFGAFGKEIEGDAITGIEDSRGLAFDPQRGTLLVSEKSVGQITTYSAGGSGAPRRISSVLPSDLPRALAGLEPERLAVAPGAVGGFYAIDAGDDAVVSFSAKGRYLGTLEGSATSAGSFDFGSNDNDIAVDTSRGPGRGDVFVLSGKGDGTVWAFSRTGKFLWELEPESNDEFAALTVDAQGNLWIAEPEDAYEYSASPGPGRPPERTGRKIDTGDEVSALTFAGGHLFVARELDSTLTTLGNVLSQIATALGFLLVPMALAAMKGAKGPREIFQRLGLRSFDRSAFKWMGLTVVLYLAFNFFYSAVITEPHQEDIAKGFGAIPIQILLIVFAAPVTEEICFRGMLFGGLREKLPRIAAALICGLIFGALHAITGVSAVPPLIVFGFLLALLYERTGSIVPGMLLHMLNNSIALLSSKISFVIRRLALTVGATALLAVPATAAAAPKPVTPVKPEVPKATVTIEAAGLSGGKATILDTVPVKGTVKPYVASQHVEVTFYLNGKQVAAHQVAIQQGPNETGTFESSVLVKEAGKYAVSAKHVATPAQGADSTVRKSWTVSFPKLNRGECSDVVGAFKSNLAKMGYVSGGGKCFTARLGREVLAYRKVNGMDRTKKAGPGLLKSVFAGKGGYQVKYPDAGEHVEAPLALQVLVLIKDGKPFAIYPISSGKPSTPTVTGHYSFYRQEPGYNSEGMYYSFYWHNGYAVHGYHEVPNYAASHGCLRTFIADQPRIYEELHYGESIYVF